MAERTIDESPNATEAKYAASQMQNIERIISAEELKDAISKMEPENTDGAKVFANSKTVENKIFVNSEQKKWAIPILVGEIIITYLELGYVELLANR